MNPRQNFYSSVFEQITNYKKEKEFESHHHFFSDPIIGLGLFAAILAVGVFSGYLQIPNVNLGKDGGGIASILKIEERSAADIFSPDTSSASNDDAIPTDAFVLIPSEDGYVSADSPQKAYGSEKYLKIEKTPEKNVYLKFRVPADATFTRAELRLNPTDSNESGGSLSILSDNLWSERLLTYNSQPSGEVINVGSIGSVSSRIAKMIDVTSHIQPGKAYTFKISATEAEGVDYSSRESSSETSPALVLIK